MTVRKLAYDRPEFWERFAPFASYSALARRFPPSAGGLQSAGWKHVVTRNRNDLALKDLPWHVSIQGRHVKFSDDEWPEPLYADEFEEEVFSAAEGMEADDEAQVAVDREVLRLRSERDSIRRKYVKALKEQNVYSKLAAAGMDALEPVVPWCDPPALKVAKGLIKQALVVNFADWHCEHQFSAEVMEGLNWYDPPTCLRRVECTVDKTILVSQLSERISYPTLYIHDLGDNCQNHLHEDDAPTNAMPPLKAARFAAELKARAIRDYAAAFTNIIYRGVPGNHGRTTKKIAWGLPTENLDWLVYQWVRILCADLPNVTFELEDAWSATVDVEGWGFFLNHGTTDAKGGFGGISWYSQMKSDTKRTAIDVKLGRHVLVRQYGHLHVEADTPRSGGNGRIRVEPSLVGGDPFALEGMAGTYSEPAQSLLEVHAEEGLVAERTLHIRKYDLNKKCRYDGLLALV